MPDNTFLPPEVVRSIEARLRRQELRALRTFASAAEDEDSMTSHVFGKLETERVRVLVRSGEVPGTWTWSFGYTKFRGRGRGATESYVGADGILEFALIFGSGERVKKGALFQAKMGGTGGSDLVRQAIKLSTWREAAFIVDYASDGISAISLDEVLRHGGRLTRSPHTDLASFIVKEFAACKVGDRELQYDAKLRRLFWRDMANNVIETHFQLKHRARLTVKAPTRRRRTIPWHSERISPSEIHLHRLKARAADILGVQQDATPAEAKKAQRAMARLYHPDTVSSFSDLYRDLLNKRMAEVNAAY